MSNPQDANRVLFVKNLNFNTNGEDLYELFGGYGAIRQVRLGNGPKTKGTAYIVYEEVADAKKAMDKLNGFHLQDRYIVLLYHQVARQSLAANRAEIAEREAAVQKEKERLGLD